MSLASRAIARRTTCIANDTERRSHNPTDGRSVPAASPRDRVGPCCWSADGVDGPGRPGDDDVDEEGALSTNASCGKRSSRFTPDLRQRRRFLPSSSAAAAVRAAGAPPHCSVQRSVPAQSRPIDCAAVCVPSSNYQRRVWPRRDVAAARLIIAMSPLVVQRRR